VVTINPLPAQPGSITGNNSVCQGNSQIYSINPVSGATSYTWTLPTGGGWTGNSTTNSITATVGPGGGNISVTANNNCGSSPAQNLAVTVNPLPSQPGPITGNNSVCQGSSQTYSINPAGGATSYTWTLPTGGGWSGNSTTNSITAIVGTGSGNISVVANNSCGSSAAQTIATTVNSIPVQPASITGNSMVITGQINSYSILPVNGATGYTWNLSGGGTISSGQNTTSITVNWTTQGNYTLSVIASNNCGASASQSLNVVVSLATAVSSPADPFEIRLSPNPSTGQFYFRAKGVINKTIRVEIMSLQGQMVYRIEQRASSNDYSKLLDLDRLPNGFYKMRIHIDHKTYVRSFVLLR
jgi:hypothetical protein